jgi:hypothetical protein
MRKNILLSENNSLAFSSLFRIDDEKVSFNAIVVSSVAPTGI